MIPIVVGALGKIYRKSWKSKGKWKLNSIIKIGQNTEKNPGDLRRLAVTKTPLEDHQLKLIGKTRYK